MYLVDTLHQAGIGVILDWVPSHFPADAHGLAHFDGTHLYEHADPRQGFHPEWNSSIFNYGRNEVRAFLLSSALFWLDEYHADGLRVDAVASMLYLDYARKAGEWIPEPVRRQARTSRRSRSCGLLNEAVYRDHPDVQTIAEESTAWPMVSRPDLPRRAGLRHEVEHGLDARHAATTSRTTRSTGEYHHDELTFSLCVRVQRELRAAAVARRGGARQGLAARQDARRRLAAVRQPAAAATATCGRTRARSCCSWAASSASGASGATTARSSGACWSSPRTPACSAGSPT